MGNAFSGRSPEFQRALEVLSEQYKRIQSKKREMKRLMDRIEHEFEDEWMEALMKGTELFEQNFQSLKTLKDCAAHAQLGRDVIWLFNFMIREVQEDIDYIPKAIHFEKKLIHMELDKIAARRTRKNVNPYRARIIRSGQMKKSAKIAILSRSDLD